MTTSRREFLKAAAAFLAAATAPVSLATAIATSPKPQRQVVYEDLRHYRFDIIKIIEDQCIADIQRIEDQRFFDILEAL